jgi:two-component system, NtrC family, sensor kinase
MNTSARLIMLLTLMVGVVMAVGGYFFMRQREAKLEEAMRNEVRAHALTLQIALEDYYRAGRLADAKQMIDRLSDNTKIYGVALFDEGGRTVMVSDPLVADEINNPLEARRVIATGETVELVKTIGERPVFSIIMPIRVVAARRGAFEIAQPLSFVQADIASARREITFMTAMLWATIFLVVLFVTRRNLSRPIRELLGGAAAIGRGDLDYRVSVPIRGGEFARLAQDFNRMADSLAGQRRAAAREAEERLALERELRHHEALASVGRLAAGVAHEMGAPLNVIDARAEHLLERTEIPIQARQRNLTIIRAQVARITRIVRQLLNLARPYDMRREPVDLSRAVTGAVELLETDAARAGVEIEVALGDGVRVEADPELLHQALMNIGLNGLQAMPAGGRLRIECVAADGAGNGTRFAAVRVSDTGVGLGPDVLPHIFEPFYSTKEVGRGVGLGLAVSRRIVEEHGGWIEAANRPEGGAVFTIYLPRADTPHVAAPGHSEEGGELCRERDC